MHLTADHFTRPDSDSFAKYHVGREGRKEKTKGKEERRNIPNRVLLNSYWVARFTARTHVEGVCTFASPPMVPAIIVRVVC